MGYKHIKIPKEGSKITLEDGVLNVPDNPIIPYIEGDGIGILYGYGVAFDTVICE